MSRRYLYGSELMKLWDCQEFELRDLVHEGTLSAFDDHGPIKSFIFDLSSFGGYFPGKIPKPRTSKYLIEEVNQYAASHNLPLVSYTDNTEQNKRQKLITVTPTLIDVTQYVNHETRAIAIDLPDEIDNYFSKTPGLQAQSKRGAKALSGRLRGASYDELHEMLYGPTNSSRKDHAVKRCIEKALQHLPADLAQRCILADPSLSSLSRKRLNGQK